MDRSCGQVLLWAVTPARRKAKSNAGNESDPLMASFLQFLERQMTDSPQDLVAADAEQIRRIGNLANGVKIG